MEILIYYIILGFICGSLSRTLANNKGFNGFIWFWTGFLFGPLGLITAAGMPDKKQSRYLQVLIEAVEVQLDGQGKRYSDGELSSDKQNTYADKENRQDNYDANLIKRKAVHAIKDLSKEAMKKIATSDINVTDMADFTHMGNGLSYNPLITEDTLSTEQDHGKTVED